MKIKINFVPKTFGGGECTEYLSKEDWDKHPYSHASYERNNQSHPEERFARFSPEPERFPCLMIDPGNMRYSGHGPDDVGAFFIYDYEKVEEDKEEATEQEPAATESTFDFLKRHMTPLGEGYQVQGRLDEIQECTDERITKLNWVQCYLKPDVPSTRAKVVLSDIAAARQLYNLMRSTKMVALRNWLD